MKAIVFAIAILSVSTASANLLKCKKYLNQVNITCSAGMNPTKCIVDTMGVAGYKIDGTAGSFHCKGDHSQALKKSKPKKSKNLSFRGKNRSFDFGN